MHAHFAEGSGVAVDVVPAMAAPAQATCQILFGVAYITSYLYWTRVCHTRLDDWVRRWLGRKLGVHVVWKRSEVNRRELLHWGAGDSTSSERERLIGAASLLFWSCGAFLPVAGMMGVVLHTSLPNHVGHLLLLASVPMLAHFFDVSSHRGEVS